jgi:hypothetical protein
MAVKLAKPLAYTRKVDRAKVKETSTGEETCNKQKSCTQRKK